MDNKKSYKLEKSFNLIPYGKQCIEDDDINSIIEVLKSDFITTGPKVNEFEEKLAEYCGAKYAVVFNSGTSALHASYFSAGLEKGDEFITSPMTFIATSNAGLFLGANPVFTDIEKNTGNLNAHQFINKISEKTKIIVPVHYAGQPCEMLWIKEIADEHNLIVIEDACHAFGSEYEGEKVGSCKYSDMCVFSFHPVKNITTGEGGAVLTNNEKYYKKLMMFRNHGITKDFKKEYLGYYYEMQFLGYNYRMTDFQAALGISQLNKISEFIEVRRQIASFYNFTFDSNEYFDVLKENEYSKSAHHLYPIVLKNKYIHKRDYLFQELRNRNIGVQVHYIPVYFHPYYQNLGYKKGICPVSEEFYNSVISLPIFPMLSESNLNRIIEEVLDICETF